MIKRIKKSPVEVKEEEEIKKTITTAKELNLGATELDLEKKDSIFYISDRSDQKQRRSLFQIPLDGTG